MSLALFAPVETEGLVESLAFVAIGSLAVRSFIIRRASGRLVADLERSRSALTEDIAKRKLVEGEMRQSETKFRTLVTNIPGAVYRCAADDEFTMEYLSHQVEEICGYPASDFVGPAVRSFEIAEISGYPASNSVGKAVRSFASIMHRDDLGLVTTTLLEKVARGEVFDLTYRIWHADGSIRWVHDRGQGISGADGRLLSGRRDTRHHGPEEK